MTLEVSGLNRFSRCIRFSAVALFGTMLLTVPAPTRAADAASATGASDAITPKEGVIKLFDGKTLGDTYTWLKDTKREDPRKVFTVSDGMIHISGDGYGGLVTNKRYCDYHLVVEYKF